MKRNARKRALRRPRSAKTRPTAPTPAGLAVEADVGGTLRVAMAAADRVERVVCGQNAAQLADTIGALIHRLGLTGPVLWARDLEQILASLEDWRTVKTEFRKKRVDRITLVGQGGERISVRSLAACGVERPQSCGMAIRSGVEEEALDASQAATVLLDWMRNLSGSTHWRATPGGAALAALRKRLGEDDLPCLKRARGRPSRTRAAGPDVRSYVLAQQQKNDAFKPLGGRQEVYGRGFIEASLRYGDITSLFPSAARLTPLPCRGTHWLRLHPGSAIDGLAGVARVDFEFPAETLYPCLPIRSESPRGDVRNLYVRRGRAFATLEEVRLAREMGATIRLVDGFGFEPGPAETEHELGRLIAELMDERGRAAGDHKDVVKRALVSLIGRFVYPGTNGWRPEPGDAFVPEWYTLILGTARALTSEIVSTGRALMLLTDGFLLPAERLAEVERTAALRRLRSVGSGLRLEHNADAALIYRGASCALLSRSESLKLEQDNLGSRDGWVVTKVWRGGTNLTHHEFAAVALGTIHTGQEPGEIFTTGPVRFVEAKENTNLRLGASERRPAAVGLDWTHARRLHDRDANLRVWTPSEPYASERHAKQASAYRSRPPSRRRRA